jgi:hypothetical protein
MVNASTYEERENIGPLIDRVLAARDALSGRWWTEWIP